MRLLSRGACIILATGAVALVTMACAAGGTTTSSTTPLAVTPTVSVAPRPTVALLPQVVQVSVSQHYDNSFSGGTASPCANGEPLLDGDCGEALSVSCASSDQLLSGGYQIDDPLARVTGAYPSGLTTWKVVAHDEGQDGGPHPFTLTATVQCLHAGPPLGMQLVGVATPYTDLGNEHSIHKACPTGTVVTGGGFKWTMGSQGSIPTPDGWTAWLGTTSSISWATPMTYALCASSHLTIVTQAEAHQSPTMGNGTTFSVGCPSSSILVGGGGDSTYGSVTQNSADGNVSHWHFTLQPIGVIGGPPTTYTASAFADCATIS